MNSRPIGVFDSGYGGLTVLKEMVKLLPEYDFLYLGDNARAPYGTRSFEVVNQFTLECVKHLFAHGCPLVILACNTASAKALRNIQQTYLHQLSPTSRVLGVIRPITERIHELTTNKHIGILGTMGTVLSNSYPIEIHKQDPSIQVFQEACPMWVPLIENNEMNNAGADYFIKKHLDNLLKQSPNIDAIVLACTHYPLLYDKIRNYLSPKIKIIVQGEIVAASLKKYLERHQDLDALLSKGASVRYWTTDIPELFDKNSSIFLNQRIQSTHLNLTDSFI